MKAGWIVSAAAAAFAPLVFAVPAQAQMDNGVLIIYGNDKCPTDANGNEIVVCSRRPEEDRYRIPKELRDSDIPPQKQAWSRKVERISDTGATGIGSCSTVGPGGQTGCLSRMIQQGSAESKQRMDKDDAIPPE
ncbi:hypothetical protein GCM10023219_12540 [Stakelama sediminis]|uniref:Uncharacterized protein n=1 Tax=Stakelama sediminis TaxID=463200 RepID=A0A840YWQ0_9SPHN|nr:hypothetical protein [Stakelama sediminis]MBB5717979.1 hypothetical protein [Stakelama sediminis]